MSKGHLCFVAPYISNYFDQENAELAGGAERQQYLLAKRLSNDGYEISFISLIQHEDIDSGFVNIDIHDVLRRPNNIPNILFSFLRLLQTIRSINADLYYCRGNRDLCVATATSCYLLNHDYIYAVADDNNVRSGGSLGMSQLFATALEHSSGVICQTETQKELLHANFGLEGYILPNMYPRVDESELVSYNDREYFLWVGALERNQKQPHILLELAEDLPDAQFVMVGPSKDTDYSREVVRSAERLPNVNYVGFIKPREIFDYYKRAIAVINTSQFEGFPNTFLEAWNYGTPVLSLNFTLDNILVEEDVGYVAENYTELVSHSRDLLNNIKLRYKLGSRSRRFFIRSYCLEEIYPEYLEYISDILY